jgi:hypothetical protein
MTLDGFGFLASKTPGEISQETSARFSRLEKYLAAIGAVLCGAAFFAAGKVFRIPADAHFSASLVQQPSTLVTILVIAIVFGVSVIIGTLVAGRVGFDAGIFCASAGLCALSARGGAMRYTLFDDPHANVWIKLILDLLILAAILAGGTLIERLLHRFGLLHLDEHRHVVTEIRESFDQRAIALAANVLVTAALMMLFTTSDRKAQVIAAIAISSFLGTLAAYYIVPTKPSYWYWSAPLLVGLIGYLLQSFGSSDGWQIGEVRGTFAALARPLPLDYAGAGVASSIIGYWMSRRWQHEREINDLTEENA